MTTNKKTVFVVDDDQDVRDSLVELLENAGYATRAFGGGRCFLKSLDHHSSGCLVLDLKMPGLSGLDVLRRVREKGLALATIVITAFGDIPSTVEAMKLGAVEVLEKPFVPTEFLAIVQRSLTEPDNTPGSTGESLARAQELVNRLTAREAEVLSLLMDGYSVKQITGQLDIGLRTAQIHRERILAKLGINELVQLSPLGDDIRRILA